MCKGIRNILIAGVMMAMLSISCNKGSEQAAQVEEPLDTVPVLVQQIQSCSRLYTAECKVRKIITHEDEKKLTGRVLGKDFSVSLPVGERKVAIPMTATLKAYINMEELTAQDIYRNGNKIEVILPRPHVVLTSTEIDHENGKQHVDILRSRFTDKELTSYQAQGRKAIIANIPELGILEMAKQGAAKMVIPIIAKMGYATEDITITFVESKTGKGGIAWVLD